MPYTGHYSSYFPYVMFQKAFRDVDGAAGWQDMAVLYLGTGTSTGISGVEITGLGAVNGASTWLDFSNAAYWTWESGTGFNNVAVTITNASVANLTVTNIGLNVLGTTAFVGAIAISPSLTVNVGDSIVIPRSGLAFTF